MKRYRVGGLSVSSPVFLGGGVVKSPLSPDIKDYLNIVDVVGAVTIGSITPNERTGNAGVLNWPGVHGAYQTFFAEGGLHANGMRNLGIIDTMDNLPPNSPKPIVISIAGYSTDEYLRSLKAIATHQNVSRVGAIEINCSCPTMGHAPLAYSIHSLRELFIEIKKLSVTKPLWFKLSPYLTSNDLTQLGAEYPSYDFSDCPTVTETFMDELQKLLKEYSEIISAVIVSNGLPQVVRGTEIQIKRADGTVSRSAGLSGRALKAGNLKTIRFLRAHDLAVDIIGCGGVLTTQDVSDYLEAGAAAVQCSGGPIWGGGPAFFKSLTE
ncbi:MAG: hypothetical protein V4480_01900 [Patescibacteria group bacterium]